MCTLALISIPSQLLSDGLILFNSFSFTFTLCYTINYWKAKSVYILNCTKITTIWSQQFEWFEFLFNSEFSLFRQSRPLSRETSKTPWYDHSQVNSQSKRFKPFIVLWQQTSNKLPRCQVPGTASLTWNKQQIISSKYTTCYFKNSAVQSHNSSIYVKLQIQY